MDQQLPLPPSKSVPQIEQPRSESLLVTKPLAHEIATLDAILGDRTHAQPEFCLVGLGLSGPPLTWRMGTFGSWFAVNVMVWHWCLGLLGLQRDGIEKQRKAMPNMLGVHKTMKDIVPAASVAFEVCLNYLCALCYFSVKFVNKAP